MHTHTHTHDDSIRRNAMRCILPKNAAILVIFVDFFVELKLVLEPGTAAAFDEHPETAAGVCSDPLNLLINKLNRVRKVT